MATKCLHVGINDYRGSDNDLAGCVNDTRDWARVFGQRRRGTVRDAIDECPFFGNAESQIVLLDKQATRAAVLKGLLALVTSLERGDLGVFTYSGHGSYVLDQSGDEADRHDEALVCYGLDYILDDELAAIFQKQPAGTRMLVITDACHSGTDTRGLGARLLGPHDAYHKYRFLPPSKVLKSRGRRRAMPKSPTKQIDLIHFPACRDDQFAADTAFNGRPCGAFTHFAIEALCALPAGASYSDWDQAIQQRLPTNDYDQVPRANGYARALKWKIPSRPNL